MDYLKMLNVSPEMLFTKRDMRKIAFTLERGYGYVIWGLAQSGPIPIYVGKGTGLRCLMHEQKCQSKSNSLKWLAIEQHRPNIRYSILAANLTDNDAYQLEAEVISLVGLAINGTGPLTNLCYGLGHQSHGPKSKARAVVANGEHFASLSLAARHLGVHPPCISRRIKAGWPGYSFVSEGQRPRSRPAHGSPDHVASMRAKRPYGSKAVICEGVEFSSMSKAAAHYGVTYGAIRSWCLSPDRPDFITKTET